MNWTAEQRSEAQTVITRLATYQRTAGLSDSRLVRQFPDLGSTKTWRQRLVAGELDGIRPDRTLSRLRRIAIVMDGGLPEADFFKGLPFTREMQIRLAILERQTNDRRILVALAPNGCGKTTVARWAVAQSPADRTFCRLRPALRNKELHIANCMARALGADSDTTNAAEAEQRLVGLLSGQPRTVFLDQAHEGGAALMHLLRMLVDETPSRFVYLGYDTAYRRVMVATSDALIEAQAFRGRCLKPVFDAYKAGTQPRDVAAYLREAADMDASVASGLAQRLTPILQQHGNLRLLSDAIAAAQTASDSDDASPEMILEHTLGMAGLDPKTLTKPTPDIDDN
jgi:DNA transposition AAA+ family ATPase